MLRRRQIDAFHAVVSRPMAVLPLQIPIADADFTQRFPDRGYWKSAIYNLQSP
jgi:hypothetical protein